MLSAGAILRPYGEDLALFPFHSEDARSPHRLPEPIMIYLALPGLAVIPMRVLESDSISSVKLRIQTCKGFVVRKQKLVFDGRELARNDSLIRDYGVSDGNVLHLIIRVSDVRVITVKTIFGKKFKFHVEQGRTVAYVKRQIADRDDELVDLDNQKLVFEGEELDDARLIHDICKSNDAVIHLLVGKSAKVRTKPVAKDFELTVVALNVEENTCSGDVQAITRKPVEPIIVNPKVELPPVIKNLVHAALSGLEKGNPPIMSSEGTGGAYFMQDVSGQAYVAVFKPIDEEPMAMNNPRGLPLSSNGEGLKRGTRVGEGALREVAAYILDHPLSGRWSFTHVDVGFSGVPPTALVQCMHGGFNHPGRGDESPCKDFKIGSLQVFVKNCGSCEDMGPQAFPVDEVHKICVLDIRLANADRHAGNILVQKDGEGQVKLVPIDHGYCLPENFEDCTFDWLYWPQSKQPFNAQTVEYIKSLDAEEDIALLKFYGWELSPECARTLRITTMLLKKGVERGLTPYDIGRILCRETIKKVSKIELIICEAQSNSLLGASEATFLETVSRIMDHHLDDLTLEQ